VSAGEPSGNRGIGRVLSLEKNFYRLPFTPPSLVAFSVLQCGALRVERTL
jgi:hypothetical protein